jgi:hypothetical protein
MLLAPILLLADVSVAPSLPLATGVAIESDRGSAGVPVMVGLGGHLAVPHAFFHGHLGIRTGNGAHAFRGEASLGAAAVFDVVWIGGFVEPWLTRHAAPGLGFAVRGGYFGFWLGAGWDASLRPSLEPSSVRFELGLDVGVMAYLLSKGVYIPR